MKTATKRKNDEFLVIQLKNVNHPATPQLWAIAHEKAIKHENDEFLVMASNIYQVLTVVVNHLGTPKLWGNKS